ncbi:hypothetical protein SDC9_198633 [bioreactor metagenome]|uniref:Solute-binding protein n=1 Tax=bioreactor metagenome TaxID=1076179 RepID=A0A645IJG2_9ZZZZ
MQAVLKEAGKASQDYCRDEVSVDFGKSTYQSMKDAGVTVTYLTDEQKKAFSDAVADTWPDFRERIGTEIFDRVAEYMKNKE